MKFDPKFNQKTQQKTSTNHKKSTKIKKNHLRTQASGPCKGSRRAKMAQKEVGDRILEVPWDPLGEPKIIKNSKK